MDKQNKIVIYKTKDNQTEIRVQFEQETVWLSQKLMAELFEKDSDTIGLHLKKIYKSKELDEASTTEHFSVVRKEGKRSVRRNIKFYNLDAIISVGYRVNSKRGTQFRQWATERLKDYLVQGYAINQIKQTFNGKELYPSIQEKAANLLYLILKNHSFVDGNKRIAAACFLYFLDRNNLLLSQNKKSIISNEALAALTLFIATSKPDESETVKRLIISILNRNISEQSNG